MADRTLDGVSAPLLTCLKLVGEGHEAGSEGRCLRADVMLHIKQLRMDNSSARHAYGIQLIAHWEGCSSKPAATLVGQPDPRVRLSTAARAPGEPVVGCFDVVAALPFCSIGAVGDRRSCLPLQRLPMTLSDSVTIQCQVPPQYLRIWFAHARKCRRNGAYCSGSTLAVLQLVSMPARTCCHSLGRHHWLPRALAAPPSADPSPLPAALVMMMVWPIGCPARKFSSSCLATPLQRGSAPAEQQPLPGAQW